MSQILGHMRLKSVLLRWHVQFVPAQIQRDLNIDVTLYKSNNLTLKRHLDWVQNKLFVSHYYTLQAF
jgi:hypothetical protein